MSMKRQSDDRLLSLRGKGKLCSEELCDHQQVVVQLVRAIYSESASPLVHNERNRNVEDAK